MGQLSPEDFSLSMRTAPRARDDTDNEGLRTLLVERLHDSLKAIRRVGLRTDKWSTFCEPCGRWVPSRTPVPEEWTCPHCARLYGVEYVVYGELDSEDDGGVNSAELSSPFRPSLEVFPVRRDRH